MTSSSLSSGRFTAATVDAVVRPRLWGRAAGRRVALFCGGAGDSAAAAAGVGAFGDATRTLCAALAANGHVVVSPTVTGLWGTDLAVGRLDDALTYARANGASSAPALLIGVSMGAGTVLRWASLHPTEVAAVAGIIPAVDYQALRVADAFGARASIDAAWGVVYPAALPAGSDPATLDFTQQHVALWYAPDDATVAAGPVIAFAAAQRAQLTSVGNLGHTNAAVAAVDPAAILELVA